MIYQHGAGRTRGRTWHGRRIGVLAIGDIIYPQFRIDRYAGPVLRDPVIVEGFLNLVYSAHRRGADGRWTDTIMAGGHLVRVRSLRTGRTLELADHNLLRARDEGWEEKSPTRHADRRRPRSPAHPSRCAGPTAAATTATPPALGTVGEISGAAA